MMRVGLCTITGSDLLFLVEWRVMTCPVTLLAAPQASVLADW
jgi:hypothetical protein